MDTVVYLSRDSFQRGDGTGATRRVEDTPNFILEEEALLLHQNEAYGIHRPAVNITTVSNVDKTMQTNEAFGISARTISNERQDNIATPNSPDSEEYILPISQDKMSYFKRSENETATSSVFLEPSVIQTHVNQAYGIIHSTQGSMEHVQPRLVVRLAKTSSQAPADSITLRLQKHMTKKVPKTKISRPMQEVQQLRELVVIATAAMLSVLTSGTS